MAAIRIRCSTIENGDLKIKLELMEGSLAGKTHPFHYDFGIEICLREEGCPLYHSRYTVEYFKNKQSMDAWIDRAKSILLESQKKWKEEGKKIPVKVPAEKGQMKLSSDEIFIIPD